MDTRQFGNAPRIAMDTFANRPVASSADLQVGDQFFATDEAIMYTLYPDLLAPTTARQWLGSNDVMLLSNAAIAQFDGVTAVGAATNRVIIAATTGGRCCGIAQNAATAGGVTVIVRTGGLTSLKTTGVVTLGDQLAIDAGTPGSFKTASALVQATGAASLSHAHALQTTGGALTIKAILELTGIVPTSFA